MIYLVNVNEVTVFYLLWLALTKRKPYVLAITPYFPAMASIFQPLIERLKKSGVLSEIKDLCPGLDHVHEVFAEIYLYNILGKIEAWQNSYFKFTQADISIPHYAMAYKHVTCSYIRTHYLTILTLNQIIQSTKEKKIKVIGLLPSTSEALTAFNKQHATVPALWLPWGLMNVFIFLGISLYSVGWILFHTRLAPPNPKSLLLVADYIGDPRDLTLIGQLAQLGEVALVKRFQDPTTKHIREHEQYQPYTIQEGRFNLSQALNAIGRILWDGARLFSSFYTREPAHYFQIATLPYRRIILRALFNLLRPQFFWGRDDYNVEHILRRQELHRVGGVSLGINHGFPSYTNLFPQWRYISFDHYYVFGRAVYERIYKDTWAEDMSVVPIGSFGATREDYDLIKAKKPNDIVVFCAIFTGSPHLVQIVRDLANSFPERTIWLQIKINYQSFPRSAQFIEDCTRDLKNVVYTTDSPRSLFSRAAYAVSDASTTVIEALQFGLVSFMADIHPQHEVCLYREFDDLCIDSSGSLIKRIKDIENGRWSYPRDSYGELIDLSGRPFTDIILEDIKLSTSKNVNV